MPPQVEIEIVIIGSGSRFGLWVLGIVAKIFHINLEVKVVE